MRSCGGTCEPLPPRPGVPMKKLSSVLCALALATAGLAAHAHEFKLGAITIGHPFARATVPGQPTGGGYLKLINGGADDRLLSAQADVSKEVQLHVMNMDGDVMRMRQVDDIA